MKKADIIYRARTNGRFVYSTENGAQRLGWFFSNVRVGEYDRGCAIDGATLYENDIVRSESHGGAEYLVAFADGGFCAVKAGVMPIDINMFFPSSGPDLTVVGTLHDAPERAEEFAWNA